MVSAYLYTLLCLSDNTVCEQSIRVNMGWSLLGIVSLSTIVNLIKTIVLIVRECRHQLRVRNCKKRYEESLMMNQKNLEGTTAKLSGAEMPLKVLDFDKIEDGLP